MEKFLNEEIEKHFDLRDVFLNEKRSESTE
jgi:hypothetical protein